MISTSLLNAQYVPKRVAQFAPEWVAQFTPKRVAQFAPEWVAQFAPEWVAQFTPEYSGKGIVGQIIGGAVHQKIGRNPEGICKFGHNIGRRERPLFFVASDLRIMYSDFGSKFT